MNIEAVSVHFSAFSLFVETFSELRANFAENVASPSTRQNKLHRAGPTVLAYGGAIILTRVISRFLCIVSGCAPPILYIRNPAA